MYRRLFRFLLLLILCTSSLNLVTSVSAQRCTDPFTGRPVPCTPTPIPDPEQPPQDDRDGDGVSDNADRCPDEGGPAQNFGCPFVDSDGDGTTDENDLCPSRGGPAWNNGCPEDVPTDQQPTAAPTAETVPVTFPDDGKCWVGNSSSFNVNRRKYPSLNAPITGQLQPGSIARAVGDYTDNNNLKWYSLAIFADPNSNAYIVDWVAASVVIASGGCTDRRAEALNLASQVNATDWDFVTTPVQLNPPTGILQICDGQPIATYLVDTILDCDGNPIPEPFDGSQIYCEGIMMGIAELPTCTGAEGIIIINGLPLFPAAIKIHPPDPGKQAVEDGTLPILNSPALLLFGAMGEPMEGEDEPPMPMLVAFGSDGGLGELSFNPQPEPPAIDLDVDLVSFNPQPEPPANPFDLFGDEGGGFIALQLTDPTDPEWASWQSTYGLPAMPMGASGFWMMQFEGDDGMRQTALIPMLPNDLSYYGFNPQPEPPSPALFVGDEFGNYQLNPIGGSRIPSLSIYGFNPQPEPPAIELDVDLVGFNPQPEPPARLLIDIIGLSNIVPFDSSVDYNTVRLDGSAVLVPIGGNTYMNLLTSNLVLCPSGPVPPVAIPYPNVVGGFDAPCVEFNAAN